MRTLLLHCKMYIERELTLTVASISPIGKPPLNGTDLLIYDQDMLICGVLVLSKRLWYPVELFKNKEITDKIISSLKGRERLIFFVKNRFEFGIDPNSIYPFFSWQDKHSPVIIALNDPDLELPWLGISLNHFQLHSKVRWHRKNHNKYIPIGKLGYLDATIKRHGNFEHLNFKL